MFLGLFCRRVKDIIVQHKGSLVLELQQRSLEFNSIIEKHENIKYVKKNFTVLSHYPSEISILQKSIDYYLMEEFMQICTGRKDASLG